MKHRINFGEGEILELSVVHSGWLLISLSDEDVSFTEAVLTKPEQIDEIITALREHRHRMVMEGK